ncbi:MAG: hypothetical protein JWQ40_5225 [Segetibacter sp.]|jgi:hypothetical protein|nr:hypothetical protein [Segetibacter sp.]
MPAGAVENKKKNKSDSKVATGLIRISISKLFLKTGRKGNKKISHSK